MAPSLAGRALGAGALLGLRPSQSWYCVSQAGRVSTIFISSLFCYDAGILAVSCSLQKPRECSHKSWAILRGGRKHCELLHLLPHLRVLLTTMLIHSVLKVALRRTGYFLRWLRSKFDTVRPCKGSPSIIAWRLWSKALNCQR